LRGEKRPGASTRIDGSGLNGGKQYE